MSRWARVVGVVSLAAVVATVVVFDGRTEVAPSSVPRAPVTASVGGEGGSWYCSARDICVDAAFAHTVFVSSVGDDASLVHLDGFDDSEKVAGLDLTVEPGATTAVDVAESLGSAGLSVMAESDGPVVVEHRISSDSGADQVPCSTFSSDVWYFPIAVTTRDATAQLNLFNPFPGDASVDIEIALETGVRQPTPLSGIVVPAGSTRVVDLREQVERREQFAFTVRTRSGGVVPELAQSFDGSQEDAPVKGLRLVSGSRTAGSRWSFPGGFADPEARERLVVQNTTDEEVDVLAQLVPFGGLEVMPEPFEITAPALRYGPVDLEADSRVPAQGYHSIDLESAGRAPVVPARSLNVFASADGGETALMRAVVGAGTTASPGLSVSATDWVATGMQRSEALDGTVFVHNPGSEAAEITVTASVGADDGELVRFEIPAGDAVAVDLASLTESSDVLSVMVHSDRPVAVERLIVFRGVPDLSIQSAVPVLESLEDLVDLGGR